MKVIAAPGLKVPTEKNPRQYITDAEPVEIDITAYYLRRLADRELLEVEITSVGSAAVPADPTDAASKSARSK